MRLSTKGRYAVTAMLDLAIHHGEGPVTLAGISENQGISLSYLEQLFARLKRHGLVEGLRGPGGGYRLSRRPDDISVAQVITAIGEGIDVTQCNGNENCQNGERCLTHELWTKLGNEIYSFLDNITLQSFIQQDDVNEVIRRQQRKVEVPALRVKESMA
jgi:Rrf2 family iron-sulfur cluster assembly transcriptional regulator